MLKYARSSKVAISVLLLINLFLSIVTPISAAVIAESENNVVVEWDYNTMKNYNCYAFALGVTNSFVHPGHYSNGSFSLSLSISDLAYMVRNDLISNSFNQKCVSVSTTLGNTSGVEVICIRKTLNILFDQDYHFMKLTIFQGVPGWYHKVGGSAIMRYKKDMSNSISWAGELYDGAFKNNGCTYDSTIYYIKYRANHSYAGAKKLVDNYHAGRLHYYQYGYECTNCPAIGNTYWVEKSCSGPPCVILYTP